MSSLSIWLEATRPKTLPAALTPVLLGSGLALADGCLQLKAAGICLAFALLIQIGTNFANDYLDGVKGTDRADRVGPRRAVASGLIPAQTMKQAALLALLAGFCVGLMLIPFGGTWLLGVGIASVICAWCYTGGPFPLAYNGLGDLFVVFFFGFIAVGCTYYVQAGRVTAEVLWLGLACGMLVNNLLVVNNYRDVDEDAVSHKRTVVVLFGRGFGVALYWAAVAQAGLVLIWLAARGYSPLVLLGLIPVAYSGLLARRLPRAETGEDYRFALKGAGLAVAGYGFVVSVGLAISRIL